MNLRTALCVVVAVSLWSCSRSAPERSTGTKPTGPLVSLEGYEIDVKAAEPAVPVDLEADLLPPRIPRLPGVARLEGLDPQEASRPGAAQRASRLAAARAEAPRARKWIVQLEGPVHEADKVRLSEAGARLGDYLPRFAFVATMDDEALARVRKLEGVRGVVRYKPAYKISPRLKDESGAIRVEGAGKRVKLRVRADSPEGLVALLSEVHNAKGKVRGAAKDLAQVEVSQADIARLAQLEDVLWIEEAVPLQLVNDTSRWTIQTYVPGDTRISDQGLDGAGQIVGIGDSGLDDDSCYFRDPTGAPMGPAHRKVVGYTVFADDYDDAFGHGTHVSGTVCGDQQPITGQTSGDGMAPKAKLYMSDIGYADSGYVYPPDDLGELFITPYLVGARIHTNSWGAGVNVYDVNAWSLDRFVWEHKDFLVLFANTNNGPSEGTVGLPATAKDVVSVGATWNGTDAENVASFSSHGPTYDGRVKPTLTAPGVYIVSADSDAIRGSNNCGTFTLSGTSMATPTAAGAAALVRQYYVDGYWPSGMARAADALAPSAALVKATLLDSAQNASGEYTDGPIPSTGQGWGRINLSNTLRFAGDERFLDVLDSADGLITGASWSKAYYSPGGTPLKVTLVWSDYPAAQSAATALVNDLDLEVTAPDGTTIYRGNVFADGGSVGGGAADRLNVEEQVYLASPARGRYTVRVSGYDVPQGPQPFAVVVTSGSAVTSQGSLALDRGRYNAATTVQLKVADRDLDVDPSAPDEAWVTLRSDADPIGEQVRLVETGKATALFVATVPTGPAPGTPGDGVLAVADGAAITATYRDADDGTGAPATVTEAAVGDLVPPVISAITVADLDQGDATIAWTTNEPADSVVQYGETAALGAAQSSRWLVTAHSVTLPALEEATTYRYAVQATDEAGNVTRDDAGGALRSFTTLTLPPELQAHSSRSGETHDQDTVLFGTARDPSGVASLTVNGRTVAVRAADGYWEIVEPLALGENTFVVVATDGRGLSATTTLSVTRLPLPDLVMTSVTGPARAAVATPFSSTVTICNTGPVDATPDAWQIAWILVDEAGSGYVVKNVREWNWVTAGSCLTRTASISVGEFYGGKTWRLAAYADLYDDIWESDDDNNWGEAPNPIYVDLPDLVVTNVAVPSTVGTATPFEVATTVTNAGAGATWNPTIWIYLSTDDVITTADRRIAVHTQPGMLPGNSSTTLTTSVTLPCDLAPGSYRVGAMVDPAARVAESHEDNNVFAGPQVTLAVPDLVVTSVSGPAAALTGSEITVHDVVSAQPTGGGATLFKVALYLSSDAVVTAADVPLGSRWVEGLASGASSEGDVIVKIPETIASGSYHLGAIVDADHQVLEGVESNNAGTGTPITIAGPDLAVTEASAPATGVTGGTITVFETVAANASGGAAPPFDVGIYLSSDATISTADTLIGWRSAPALAPGGSSSATTPATLPATLAPGTYYLGVIADDFYACWENAMEEVTCIGGDVAKEPSGADNVRLAGSITIGGANLTMAEVSAPPTGYTGVPLVVRNTVAATGGGTGMFEVSFYLSTDATITTSDTYLGKRWVGGLAPGGTDTAETSLTIPATVVPGTWWVGAIADSGNVVVEPNENDNLRASGAVSIKGADLTVVAVGAPQTIATASTIALPVTVKNVGEGGSGTFYLSVYLSSDATITPADSRLAYKVVGPLAPGATAAVTLDVTVGNVAAGTWYLGAFADQYNQVKESSETNNTLAVATTVAGPDLTVTSASGPSSALTGATVVVNDTVAASGGGGASFVYVGYYLSADAVVTTADQLLGSRYVTSLAAGATSAASTSVTIPTTISGGTYHLGVIVDNGGAIPEADEGNNVRDAGVIAITGPDLVATSVSGPASAARGSAVTLSDTVTAAASGGAAPEFYVGLFLSADTTITTADRQVGTRWVGGLGPGAVSSASTSVTVPPDLPPGTYHVGMIVDDLSVWVGDDWEGSYVENNAKESNEGNNAVAGGTIVVQ